MIGNSVKKKLSKTHRPVNRLNGEEIKAICFAISEVNSSIWAFELVLSLLKIIGQCLPDQSGKCDWINMYV